MLVPLLTVLTFALGDGLPTRSPGAVGMSATRLAAIDRVVSRGISEGGFPGATVVVGRKGYAVWQKGFGRIDWSKTSARVNPVETVYDLASLTKVVATTTAIMILYDEGKVDLEAPVGTYLPLFRGGQKDAVTIRHLLTHRSGLPASRDLWRAARSPLEARLMTLETPLGCKPGDCYIYSDIGAIILGMVAEAVSGVPLDEFVDTRIFGPLRMTSASFRPPDSLHFRIAPTEVTPPRGYPLRGEVHDENAYALGGVAGHAGLFASAADLAVFAQMMINGGEYDGVRIVSDSAVRLFTRRAAGHRALGWDIADGGVGSGRYLSEGAYGHTGYTGTSLWIDPDQEMFVILLTNRVHAARARRPAKVISDVRADLSDAAALAVTDGPAGILAMPAAFRADRAVGWNRPERVVKSKRSKAKRTTSKKTATRASTSKASKSKPSTSKASTAKARASKASPRSKSPTKARASKATAPRGRAASAARAAPTKAVPRKTPARKPASTATRTAAKRS